MGYRHYCVQFPPSIRAELKLKYKKWYAESLFLEKLDSPSFPGTLILPSQILIENRDDIESHKIIAFGNSGSLAAAFLAGAKDFLKDPWDCEELIIRSSSKKNISVLKVDNHVISYCREFITIDSGIVDLSSFQTRLLYLLMNHANKILTYNEIREKMGMTSPNYTNSLHVHINHIRTVLLNCLPDIYGKSFVIENKRSTGYCFKATCG